VGLAEQQNNANHRSHEPLYNRQLGNPYHMGRGIQRVGSECSEAGGREMRDDWFWPVILYGAFLGVVGTLIIQYLARHLVLVWV
jgi:hypothetical protein